MSDIFKPVQIGFLDPGKTSMLKIIITFLIAITRVYITFSKSLYNKGQNALGPTPILALLSLYLGLSY